MYQSSFAIGLRDHDSQLVSLVNHSFLSSSNSTQNTYADPCFDQPSWLHTECTIPPLLGLLFATSCREVLHSLHMTDVFYLELISQHLLFEDVVKCSSLCALRVFYHPNLLMIEARSYCFVAHQMTDELELTIFNNCSPYSIF